MFHPDKLLLPENVWQCEVQLDHNSQAKYQGLTIFHPKSKKTSASLEIILFLQITLFFAKGPYMSENDIKMFNMGLCKILGQTKGLNVLVRFLSYYICMSLNAGRSRG